MACFCAGGPNCCMNRKIDYKAPIAYEDIQLFSEQELKKMMEVIGGSSPVEKITLEKTSLFNDMVGSVES